MTVNHFGKEGWRFFHAQVTATATELFAHLFVVENMGSKGKNCEDFTSGEESWTDIVIKSIPYGF